MRCPTCKRSVDATPRNPFRPFCSERCRMVDLGTWAAEKYRVAGGKAEDDSEHPDDGMKHDGATDDRAKENRVKEDRLKKSELN
ncbi:MAG: DNA gyrase inhibitor YacG [Candidatus Binataceae bacterium]